MAKKIKDPNDQKNKEEFPGYPQYPGNEDIYSKEKKEKDIDPDDLELTTPRPKTKLPGDDLDVPGAELDDADEEIGEEDEENNYYSLGGDDHDDLEEDKGD